MSGGGRKVKVTMSGDLGQLLQFAASPELERLGKAAGRAADGAEKLDAAARKRADADERAQQKAQDAFANASRRLAVEGVGASAIQSLGQSGAGATDAMFAGIRGLQAALPALGATFGAASGRPGGQIAGLAGGSAAAAALERQFGPEFRARETAIAEVTEMYRPAAAQGVELTKEELQEALTQAILIARRQLGNEGLEGKVRAAAGGFP